ncbi:MAG: hypothetical protein HEQ23_16260 [Tepidisphaera sp.]
MGLVADLGLPGEDQADWAEQIRQQIAEVTRAAGLPDYIESAKVEDDDETSGRAIGSYSALHRVRRYAAYLRADRAPTPIGKGNASSDPILQQYADQSHGRMLSPTVFEVIPTDSPGPSFDHLVHHGDSDGVYLPFDFPNPLWLLKDDVQYSVGSSVRLLQELELLRWSIGVPADVVADDDRFFEWDVPEACPPGWGRFMEEARPLVNLLDVARRSVETGILIHFC